MTKKEILSLGPGPETDRLVAERVMGWGLAEGLVEKDDFLYDVKTERPWSPSTDIAAAWEVIKRLMDKQYDITIDIMTGAWWRRNKCQYIVRVMLDEFRCTGDVVANSLPLAICRAALLAVMEGET